MTAVSPTPTPAVGWRARLPPKLRAFAAPLEVEDLLLAVWVLALERVVLWYLGAGRAEPLAIEQAIFRGDAWPPIGAIEPSWIDVLSHVTVLGWSMVAGLLFVLVTKGPEDRTLDDWLGRRFLLVPPPAFYALHVLAILAWVGARLLGRAPGSNASGPGVGTLDRGRLPSRRRERAAPLGATPWAGEPQPPPTEPRYWGPTAPRALRRLAVVPAALLGESALRGMILSSGFDFSTELRLATVSWPALRAAGAADLLQLLLELVLLGGAFAFLVAGPRIAAGSTLIWQAWITRFALFAAATVAAGRVVAP